MVYSKDIPKLKPNLKAVASKKQQKFFTFLQDAYRDVAKTPTNI